MPLATCPKPHCAVDYDGSRAHHGSAQCPEVVIAPFAIGPIEVRSRPLARQIADCSNADNYFSALTQRGIVINRPLLVWLTLSIRYSQPHEG